MRTIPRWAITVLWAVVLPLVYVLAPYGLSLMSIRHSWHEGNPGLLNDLGLIGVIGGAAIVVWVLREHFFSIPKDGARAGDPFAGPGYVLTKGPYGFCRHPMHVGTLLIWFGWALFYGSVAVLLGAALILLAIVLLVPSEERGMEAQLGEQYRSYMAEVPRWGFRRRTPRGN